MPKTSGRQLNQPLSLNKKITELNKVFNKAHYLYSAFFCEENIWQLLKKLTTQGLACEKIWVLFITNPVRKVLLRNQQAAPANDIIIWDYHVILLAEIDLQYLIFDFDTRLPFVTPLRNYLQHTFIISDELSKDLTVYIRKIPAKSYLEKFSSDRSHMLNQLKPAEFPSWPMINVNQHQTITLDSYLNVEQDIGDGSLVFKVSSLPKLEQWLVRK